MENMGSTALLRGNGGIIVQFLLRNINLFRNLLLVNFLLRVNFFARLEGNITD